MSPPEVWGPPIWTLFHVLAEKINERAYPFYAGQLFSVIKNICSALPCPECTSDASIFLGKIKILDLKTKTDFKNMVYLFHNYVNAKKRKRLYNYSGLEVYKNYNIVNVFNRFISVYHTRGNMKLLAESFQRQNIIKTIRAWFSKNIMAFVPVQQPVNVIQPQIITEEENVIVNENIVVVEEVPVVPEVTVVSEEETPVTTEEVPIVTEEASVVTEEVPIVTEDVPIVTEEVPIVTEDVPVVTEDVPIVTEEVPIVTEEAHVTSEKQLVTEEQGVIEETVVSEELPVTSEEETIVTEEVSVVYEEETIISEETHVVTEEQVVIQSKPKRGRKKKTT
jgi:hypothetical protein